MTTAGVVRALSTVERSYADGEVFVGYTARVAGPLDTGALEAAYAAVCDAYPHLAARLGDSADGPVFVASDERPDVQVREGDPDRPLTDTRLDPRRALSAVAVVRDGPDASVALVTHHSVADAHHSLGVLADLWSCYTDAVHGVPLDLPRHPYPRSLEDLLGERGYRPATVPASPPAAPAPAPELITVVRHVAQYRPTAAQTAAVVELGHREDVTVNGLVSALILLTEAALLDVPVTDLVYGSAVNLRDRVTPPIGRTEGTNVVGGARFALPEGTEPDAVAVARAIGAQLRAGLADGSIHRSLLDMAAAQQAAGAAPRRTPAGAVNLTNWGRVPPLRTPEGLRIRTFHSASRVRLAPERVGGQYGYVLSSFDGRLAVDVAHPDGSPERPERLDGLRERMDALTARLTR